jgi:16S rRNA (guanine527-N7)-methyltransferase
MAVTLKNYATESKTNSPTSGRRRAPAPLSEREFQQACQVPDEIMIRLRLYNEQLARWQEKINLVGPQTLADPWRRHFLDSAQLFGLLPDGAETIVDIGSGAGFPGLVLAILATADGAAPRQVHLIDSDQRKCVFLREINRLTDAGAIIHSCRSAQYGGPKGDAITARACAPLGRLFGWAQPLLAPSGRGLFLKGEGVQDELTQALKDWRMEVIQHSSQSDPRGVILEVTSLAQLNDS